MSPTVLTDNQKSTTPVDLDFGLDAGPNKWDFSRSLYFISDMETVEQITNDPSLQGKEPLFHFRLKTQPTTVVTVTEDGGEKYSMYLHGSEVEKARENEEFSEACHDLLSHMTEIKQQAEADEETYRTTGEKEQKGSLQSDNASTLSGQTRRTVGTDYSFTQAHL